MTSSPRDPVRELSGAVRGSWQRFLDTFEPLRPELYRYCRYLTRSPWDAEDLVQDALARAFVTLGSVFGEPPGNPRAWLFRVASNLWIDRVRRRDPLRGPGAELPEATAHPDPRAPREAAGTLLVQLSPQERAAVVLKDVFELSLEEIAEALSTTVGAVKAALHRGRGKLADPEPAAPRAPTPAALDAFCDAFNARDLDRLTALLLDTATVEIVGLVTEYGADAARDPDTGSLYNTLFTPLTLRGEQKGIDPQHLHDALPEAPRCAIASYRGEPILLYWYTHAEGEAVRSVALVETDGGGARIARLRQHFFSPDVIAEVCRELGVPFHTNGYAYWR